MESKKFCQRCAMPMEKPKDFGTHADGSENEDYCCYCYENGVFLSPDATMEQFIESCLLRVVPDVFADEATAKAAMNKHFSTLKYWKKTGRYITYKLKDGVSTEDFLVTTDKAQEQYLSKCKGFITRQLWVIDGVWIDWTVWETFPDSKNSLYQSEENEAAKEFSSLISEFIEPGAYSPLERSY